VSFVTRLGLAITAPRDALAIAGQRRHAGRSGSDLLAAIAILLVATELRWIIQALWLGATVAASVGLRALVQTLTGTVALDLGLLAIAAAIIAVGGRLMHDLGRAFDLACVAVLPLVFVDLGAGVIVATLDVTPIDGVRWGIIALACGWSLVLVVLAIVGARRVRDVTARSVRAGWIVVALAAIGVAVQLVWVANNAELLRAMRPGFAGGSRLPAGTQAPAIALPRVGADGSLGARVSIAPGKVTVLDFWATWCGPCREALPWLDNFARQHPDIDVLTINLDDAVEARQIFDHEHYALTLLADDGTASTRYGVESIPHEVLIGPDGTIVSDGGMSQLEREITRMRH
jgi:cytochrome c biogenesis protein CcmG/thiol:disulfide interchange protein DsbE